MDKLIEWIDEAFQWVTVVLLGMWIGTVVSQPPGREAANKPVPQAKPPVQDGERDWDPWRQQPAYEVVWRAEGKLEAKGDETWK